MSDAERLVIDASVAVKASLVDEGFERWRVGSALVAPTLIWSEFASAINQLRWRGEIDDDGATAAIRRFTDAPIEAHPSRDLIEDATALARQLGWAKTYDAEYVALARRIGAPLVTLDARLHAQASSLITVLSALDAAD